MTANAKIVPFEALAPWRAALAPNRSPLVVTNGCFDILHVGHAQTLAEARSLGASLLVGITGDAGVRVLKGEARPIFPEQERAELIAAFAAVDFVCVFPHVNAVEFLRFARPDIYAKGGGYALETINMEERTLLEAMRVPIKFLAIREGRSSSNAIRALQGHKSEGLQRATFAGALPRTDY